MTQTYIILIVIVAMGALLTNSINGLEKKMSVLADEITAAFDDFKVDVAAKLAAFAAAVKPSMTQAEADAIVADIKAAKTAVDAQPTNGTPAIP